MTPYSVVEFQGGSFDPWGGLGFEQCSVLINHEFERVFYKNMFASGVTIFNIYMVSHCLASPSYCNEYCGQIR